MPPTCVRPDGASHPDPLGRGGGAEVSPCGHCRHRVHAVRSSCLSRIHFPASLPCTGLSYSPRYHGIRRGTQSALGHLQYCEGSDSYVRHLGRRSPRLPRQTIPSFRLQPRRVPRYRLLPRQRIGLLPGFALESQARRNTSAESSSSSYGPTVRLRLLPTPPRGDAVTFDYGVVAPSDTDLHRANLTPSRAHDSSLRWNDESLRLIEVAFTRTLISASLSR